MMQPPSCLLSCGWLPVLEANRNTARCSARRRAPGLVPALIDLLVAMLIGRARASQFDDEALMLSGPAHVDERHELRPPSELCISVLRGDTSGVREHP